MSIPRSFDIPWNSSKLARQCNAKVISVVGFCTTEVQVTLLGVDTLGFESRRVCE
jgi:hypothetical protein